MEKFPTFKRVKEASEEAKKYGFSLTPYYRGSTQKGYSLANYNQLDEFGQPQILLAENLHSVASKINQVLVARKKVSD